MTTLNRISSIIISAHIKINWFIFYISKNGSLGKGLDTFYDILVLHKYSLFFVWEKVYLALWFLNKWLVFPVWCVVHVHRVWVLFLFLFSKKTWTQSNTNLLLLNWNFNSCSFLFLACSSHKTWKGRHLGNDSEAPANHSA